MAWIKRNLIFVVGLAVALVLLAAGVMYLLSSKGAADNVEGDLASKSQELDRLVTLNPAPNSENIKLAREEQQRVAGFVSEARRRFPVPPALEQLDNASFKALLESKIDELKKQAESSGVSLPASTAGYGFTFEEQRKQLQLPERTLQPLAAQLLDIEALCEVLFAAKIHSLTSIRRSAVGTNESSILGNYLAKKVATNALTGAVVQPFEITFQSFSAELAGVLSGLIESPRNIVVKTINVERGQLDSPGAAALPLAGMAGRFGGDPALARRYGMAQPAPVAAATKPGEPVLDDKPLRITLGLEVIKIPTPATNAPPAGRRPVAGR
jgi:hypothetical protein